MTMDLRRQVEEGYELKVMFEVQLTGGRISMRILIVNLSEYRLI